MTWDTGSAPAAWATAPAPSEDVVTVVDDTWRDPLDLRPDGPTIKNIKKNSINLFVPKFKTIFYPKYLNSKRLKLKLKIERKKNKRKVIELLK